MIDSLVASFTDANLYMMGQVSVSGSLPLPLKIHLRAMSCPHYRSGLLCLSPVQTMQKETQSMEPPRHLPVVLCMGPLSVGRALAWFQGHRKAKAIAKGALVRRQVTLGLGEWSPNGVG